MRRVALALIIAVTLLAGCAQSATSPDVPTSADQVLSDAYARQQSGVQVSGEGRVIRILSDDNEGGRHQRFILELASGQTLLVAHNIDVAPRIPSLRTGDSVKFNGVYEWNDQGGVVHWTHHDPQGQHEPGWLDHGGLRYQ